MYGLEVEKLEGIFIVRGNGWGILAHFEGKQL